MHNPSNTTQVTQVLCEPGHYCVDGAKYTCPKGTYGGSFGLSSRECSGPCTPGYTCANGAVDSREKQCGYSTVCVWAVALRLRVRVAVCVRDYMCV